MTAGREFCGFGPRTANIQAPHFLSLTINNWTKHSAKCREWKHTPVAFSLVTLQVSGPSYSMFFWVRSMFYRAKPYSVRDISKSAKTSTVFVDLPYIQYKAQYWVWALKCPIDAGSPSESGTRDEGQQAVSQAGRQAGRQEGCQSGADRRRSQNEFSHQSVLRRYVTVCWVMDRASLTSRFSISLTSSLTWLRIFRQHSALCWIPSFSVGSSADGQINIEMKDGGEAFRVVCKQKQ